MVATPAPRRDFDAAYYRRFYGRRPVHGRRAIGRLAEGVLGLCAWWGIPVRSVLDVGAGPGYWREWLAVNRPAVRYRGVDASPYACRRFGHELGDIAEWRPPRPYDLVVCQDVLQYLDDDRASRAISNLAAATRAVLYLQAPTAGDRRAVIDPLHSDLSAVFRPACWYRDHLARHFCEIGAGLFHPRRSAIRFYELEVAPRHPG